MSLKWSYGHLNFNCIIFSNNFSHINLTNMHALTLSDDLNSSCTVRAGGSAASDLVIQVVMIAESTRLQCMLANYGIQVACVDRTYNV